VFALAPKAEMLSIGANVRNVPTADPASGTSPVIENKPHSPAPATSPARRREKQTANKTD